MTEEEQSSEVKEEDLAQEALDATAEETPAADESVSKEPTVPLHDHTALRQRAQAAEIAQARAEGELNALKASQTQAVKSPLDLEIERQTALGIPEEDMTITPTLYRRQQEFEQQAVSQATEASRKRELGDIQVKSAKAAQANHEDWNEVVAKGDGLLTKGELLDIVSIGEGFGELYYAKLQVAIKRNAPEPESKTKTETAPEKKTSESEAEKVPTQEDILKDLKADPMVEAATKL